MKTEWFKALNEKISNENIKINEPLNLHTATKMGGNADLFIVPENEEEAQFVVKYAHTNGIPILLLGNGSNMVVRDGGVRGIVVNFSKLNKIIIDGTRVYAEGGADVKDVSKQAAAAA